MGIPLPTSRIKRFFTNPSPYDILSAIFAAVLGIQKSIDLHEVKKYGWMVIVGGITIAVLAVNVVKVLILWFKQEKVESVHDLEGCLHTLHGLLLGDPEANERDPGLRLTVHVPTADRQQLVQVVPYVGDHRRGPGTARKFPAQCGIIGEGLRLKEPWMAFRPDDDYSNYISDLVANWHYTDADARKLDPAAMAWMAVPLLNDQQEVKAIVYLDSTDRDFFTDERQDRTILACIGIARFVDYRYK